MSHEVTPEVRLIAEVGSNYDGQLDLALEYVRAASEAGADAVKFQTLRKSELVAPRIWKRGRPEENPVYSGFQNLELPEEWHRILSDAAAEVGIEFISTPFSLAAVRILEELDVRTYKIASGDITFLPLLQAVGSTGKDVILSTGASTLAEVERAVETLTRYGAETVTLLHCVVSYPPEWSEANLRAMTTLKEAFNRPVGISDHTPGSLLPIAAVTLGASVVEKHVTFDRSRPGPDHAFSLTLDEFATMANDVRTLRSALGTGVKEPTASERQRRHRFRRSRYHPTTLEPCDSEPCIWLRPECDPPDKTSAR